MRTGGDKKKKKAAWAWRGGTPSAERQREEKEWLGKCRNVARLEKDLGLGLRGIRSLTVGLSSGASSLFPHLGRRGASPGCGGRSEAQSTAGESGSLPPALEGCIIVQNLAGSLPPPIPSPQHARWLDQGCSLQEEKATVSLQCCGKRQSLPVSTTSGAPSEGGGSVCSRRR